MKYLVLIILCLAFYVGWILVMLGLSNMWIAIDISISSIGIMLWVIWSDRPVKSKLPDMPPPPLRVTFKEPTAKEWYPIRGYYKHDGEGTGTVTIESTDQDK